MFDNFLQYGILILLLGLVCYIIYINYFYREKDFPDDENEILSESLQNTEQNIENLPTKITEDALTNYIEDFKKKEQELHEGKSVALDIMQALFFMRNWRKILYMTSEDGKIYFQKISPGDKQGVAIENSTPENNSETQTLIEKIQALTNAISIEEMPGGNIKAHCERGYLVFNSQGLLIDGLTDDQIKRPKDKPEFINHKNAIEEKRLQKFEEIHQDVESMVIKLQEEINKADEVAVKAEYDAKLKNVNDKSSIGDTGLVNQTHDEILIAPIDEDENVYTSEIEYGEHTNELLGIEQGVKNDNLEVEEDVIESDNKFSIKTEIKIKMDSFNNLIAKLCSEDFIQQVIFELFHPENLYQQSKPFFYRITDKNKSAGYLEKNYIVFYLVSCCENRDDLLKYLYNPSSNTTNDEALFDFLSLMNLKISEMSGYPMFLLERSDNFVSRLRASNAECKIDVLSVRLRNFPFNSKSIFFNIFNDLATDVKFNFEFSEGEDANIKVTFKTFL